MDPGVREWKPTLQGTYGPNMSVFWWVVGDIYSSCLHVKLWSNSMNGTEVRMNIHTDEWKDENYIPLGINARCIKILANHVRASQWANQWYCKMAVNLANFLHIAKCLHYWVQWGVFLSSPSLPSLFSSLSPFNSRRKCLSHKLGAPNACQWDSPQMYSSSLHLWLAATLLQVLTFGHTASLIFCLPHASCRAS